VIAIGCIAINLPAPPPTAIVDGVMVGLGSGTVPPRHGPVVRLGDLPHAAAPVATPVTMADGTTRPIESIAKASFATAKVGQSRPCR
jgi:hypothetical protein